jgi:hypothetical protein
MSKENINGVYIPSALLLVGVAIVKLEWLPYAVIFAAVVGGYKVFAGSSGTPEWTSLAEPHDANLDRISQNPAA